MPRFNLYSSGDQKESADTSLMKLLDEMGYTQQFSAEFVRLGISFLSVAVAAGVWWVEKNNGGFRDNFTTIAVACAVYFVLQGVAYGIWRFAERRANYIGSSASGTIYVRTEAPKNSPGTYVISLTANNKTDTQRVPFGSFVDYNGNVIKKELSRVLTKLVPQSKKQR